MSPSDTPTAYCAHSNRMGRCAQCEIDAETMRHPTTGKADDPSASLDPVARVDDEKFKAFAAKFGECPTSFMAVSSLALPTDTPAARVDAAWLALEGAWTGLDHADVTPAVDQVLVAAVDLLAARRAAAAEGYVECWLSKEAVEALRTWNTPDGRALPLVALLARDLAPLLKGG